MKKFVVLSAFLVLLAGCINIQDSEIAWTFDSFEGDLSVGVELGYDETGAQEAVYFGDDAGQIYSVYKRTGNLRWQRSIESGDTLDEIYCAPNAFYAVYHDPYSPGDSTLAKYSLDQGELLGTLSLPSVPFSGHTAYTNGTGDYVLVLHSSNSVVEVNLSTLTYSPTGLSGTLNSGETVVNVLYAENLYQDMLYAITSGGRIVTIGTSVSASMGPMDGPEQSCEGSAVYRGGIIYVGTTNGVYAWNTSAGGSWDTHFPDWASSFAVKNTMMTADAAGDKLYVPFAGGYPNCGVAMYDISGIAMGAVTESWHYSTFGNVNNGSLVLSEASHTLVFIDDTGYVNAVDSASGSLLQPTTFLGTLNDTSLRPAVDTVEDIAFLPTTSPSKVFCYNLSYPTSTSKDKFGSLGWFGI